MKSVKAINQRKAPNNEHKVAKARTMEYQVGDLFCSKLSRHHPMLRDKFHGRCCNYLGPFRILKEVDKAAYLIELPRSIRQHPLFHAKLLTITQPEELSKCDGSCHSQPTPQKHEDAEVEALDNKDSSVEVSIQVLDLGQPGATTPRTSST